MFRLKRLTLKGFKSIREMDLELGDLNVLIGPNGAGKSNLFAFFRMLGAIREQRLQLFVGTQGGASAILHYGRKRTAELEGKLFYASDLGELTYAFHLAGAAPDDLIFAHEELTDASIEEARTEDKRRGDLRNGSGRREASSFFPGPRSQQEERLVRATGALSCYHFHDTSPEAPIKQGCPLNDNRRLRDNGGNLAAFLYMLKTAHRDRYERIRETISLAAPFFDDFVLEPDALNSSSIHLEWRERGSDMAFFAHQLSDGMLRFIALTAALLQPELPDRPEIILIDEPELGLHPYAITLLAAMMRAASQTAQIVVATQSVTLLDSLAETEEVVVVERAGGQSIFRRLDPAALETWLEAYSLGELWEKNVLGGRP